MVVEKTPITTSIQGEAIERLDQFVYIGGRTAADGNSEKDLIGCTSETFGKMNRIRQSRTIIKKL